MKLAWTLGILAIPAAFIATRGNLVMTGVNFLVYFGLGYGIARVAGAFWRLLKRIGNQPSR